MAKYFLLLIIALLSFFSWQSVDRALNNSGSSDWIIPLIWFSLFLISIYLGSVILKDRHLLYICLLISFSLSFVFSFDPLHFILIYVGLLIAVFGIYKIRNDLKLNIEIDLGKSFYFGKYFLIIGISLTICGQYFFTVKDREFQEVLPKIESSRGFDVITGKILEVINPDFKKISKEESVTVDDFIIEIQNGQLLNSDFPIIPEENINKIIETQFSGSATDEQKIMILDEAENRIKELNSAIAEKNKELILLESRNNLSAIVGKELTGQEKITEIFPQIINKKITDYFKPKMSSGSILPLFPAIMAIILFLSLISIGSFVSPVWTIFARFVFWILLKLKLFSISKVSKEIETIEQI